MIKRILIDVNQNFRFQHNSGIFRVVKNVIDNLQKNYVSRNIEVLPFYNLDGMCYSTSNQEIVLQKGDYILILDTIFNIWKNHFNFYLEAKQLGIPISIIQYDYTPIQYPEFLSNEHLLSLFKEFVELFIPHVVDNVICISKTVADDTLIFCDDLKEPHPNVYYWKLGCDYIEASQIEQNDTFDSLLKNKEYLLMVGTIQPRKNYRMALDAMTKMWENDSDLCLVIAGKYGWSCEDVMHDIMNHKEYNKKLFLFEDPSDEDLSYLYDKCKALMQLSFAEGFGLPLIEASYHNKEIICSDIPIFREVCGDFATYVQLNVDAIFNDIDLWYKNDIRTNSSGIKKITWDESCDELLSVILEQEPYIKSNKEEQSFEEFISKLNENQIYNNWCKVFDKSVKVMSMYHQLLQRPPDNYSYNNFLDSDLTIEEIENIILTSDEYIQLNDNPIEN